MKPVFFRLLFVLAALTSGAAVAHAQNLDTVKARIEQRISAVNGLKDRGSAGENNRGFLEARGNAGGDDQKVIGEENADRRAVYAAIASSTGSNADAVGRQRAQQLAGLARAGHWIQESNGSWRQK